MNHWFEDIPGVKGALSLVPDLLAAWPDRAMDDRLHHLRHCPVVPQELYQIARHLPLAVVDQPAGPMVMAELSADRLRRPAFDAEGRYLRSYRPQVSRLLPFCADADGDSLRLQDEIAPNGPDRPEPLRRQIAQMLRVQAAGLARLSEAAGLLIGAGLLRQGADPGDGTAAPGWQMAEAAEAAALSANLPDLPASFMALRLWGVLEFSALHRRAQAIRRSDADGLRALLSRNEVLRQKTFLMADDLLDFSALRARPAGTEVAD